MTPMQARTEARRAINIQRLAALHERHDLLARLRAEHEVVTVCDDGAKWGTVYLPNVGEGHVFAGRLSGLQRRGLYRVGGDPRFGFVRLDG